MVFFIEGISEVGSICEEKVTLKPRVDDGPSMLIGGGGVKEKKCQTCRTMMRKPQRLIQRRLVEKTTIQIVKRMVTQAGKTMKAMIVQIISGLEVA